ncbi:MAG: hypothetical protein Q9216_002481 [Gyalolechia sp. 2 TL-2023]
MDRVYAVEDYVEVWLWTAMETPISHDLRAGSTISKRARTRAEKYYGSRYVKPGQLHQPHYRLRDPYKSTFTPDSGLLLSQTKHENTTNIGYLTSRALYEEAQRWPRPPIRHRRHKDKSDKRGALSAYGKRKAEQRNHERMGREIMTPKGS